MREKNKTLMGAGERDASQPPRLIEGGVPNTPPDAIELDPAYLRGAGDDSAEAKARLR